MAVRTKYYFGLPGNYYFQDAELTNVTILNVTRSGQTHYVTFNEEATGLQFIYSPSSGGIVFNPNVPFTGPLPPLRPMVSALEKISVKFKT